MKKKVFLIIGLAAIVSITVFNIRVNLSSDSLSELALANIEALARNETGAGEKLSCYLTVSNSGSGNQTHQTYCGDCKATLCRSWWDSSECYN